MEYIESLFELAKGNPLLIFGLAIVATFLESFVPALPLIGMVTVNAMLLGFWGGIAASVIGSCLGTIVLFLLARRFSHLKFFDKLRNDKTDRITNWIKKQNYMVLYLCYACPFVPGCLVSLSSGFSNRDLKSFVPGVILGKTTMFAVASYIGYDIGGLLTNPIRIFIVLTIVVISFVVGKKLSDKMLEKNVVSA